MLNINLELSSNSLGFGGQILLLQGMEVQSRKPQQLSFPKMGQTQQKATTCASQSGQGSQTPLTGGDGARNVPLSLGRIDSCQAGVDPTESGEGRD